MCVDNRTNSITGCYALLHETGPDENNSFYMCPVAHPCVRPVKGVNISEVDNSLTCLAVRPFVSATTRASVSVHTVATRRSVLTRVARTLVNF